MNREEQWLLMEKYNGFESEAFHSDCRRLVAGEPLGYVIGFIPFLDCKIWLDNHPLIPRSETEFWVEKAITEIRKVGTPTLRILDLCAGSGAIGIAAAKALPNARVDFIDINTDLLATISKNINENLSTKAGSKFGQRSSYRVFAGDLFETFEEKLPTYDFILTNPPYIDPEIDRTEDSVKQFEPHEALYSGHLGIEIIERIITKSSLYLTQKGQLWIEHEPEQSKLIKALGTDAGFAVSTHNDQYGVERYSVLVQYIHD